LRIDPAVAGGSSARKDDFADTALDPFTFEEAAGNTQVPLVAQGDDPRITPPFDLSPAEKTHDEEMMDHIRSIEGAMDEHIHKRCRMNFAPQYLSLSAGEDVGGRRYLVHPGKVPIVGVDFVVAKSGSTNVFTTIVPVYDTNTKGCVIKARDGYGLSGLRVNARNHVEGIKFVFSKITDRGFDQSQSYETEWYGTPAAGIGQTIGGDGLPVYGFWMCKGRICKSIGLIREKR
jgi:hypothetical protein